MDDEIAAAGTGDASAMSVLYEQFLEQYLANESAFKTGPEFNEKIQSLREQLLTGERGPGRYAKYVYDVFGENSYDQTTAT